MQDLVSGVMTRIQNRANDSSESKVVAAFVKEILDEEPGNYELVVSSMDIMEFWCREFREAAMKSR